MEFICTHNRSKWTAIMSIIQSTGGFYELDVNGRGTYFKIIVGSHSYGNFITIPNHDLGCELSALDDTFWNYERIKRHLKAIDATTVVSALSHLASLKSESAP